MAKLALDLVISGGRKSTPYKYPITITGVEQELELHFRPLNDIEKNGVHGLAGALNSRYLEGNWFDKDGKLQEKADELLDGNGKKIELNEEAILTACRVEMCQDPAKEVYTATELLRIMSMDDGPWPAIITDARKHLVDGEGWTRKKEKEATIK